MLKKYFHFSLLQVASTLALVLVAQLLLGLPTIIVNHNSCLFANSCVLAIKFFFQIHSTSFLLFTS